MSIEEINAFANGLTSVVQSLGSPLWRWAGFTYFIVVKSWVISSDRQKQRCFAVATICKGYIKESAIRAVLNR